MGSLSSCVQKLLSYTLSINSAAGKQTGLFSAVVGAVVVVSVQDLRPNSQDTSAFYLENIYLLLATPNQTPSVARPPPFLPPTSAIWVNSLWFLSLVISLTCAMLATSLQQWARRYVKITQPPRCSPHKRARIRAFFAHGVDKFHVPWAVEALPALVHLSLFLFFAGLLVYLFDINHTVFTAVSCWVALLSIVYGSITLMPIFWHDSPYYAPLSSTAWLLYTGTLYAILEVRLRFFSRERHYRKYLLKKSYRQRILVGVEGAAEETASELSSEIDVRVLEQTVDALGEDDALEKFYESIPGFYKSDIVKDLRQCLPGKVQSKILSTMVEFLGRALSSNSTSASMKNRRLAIYVNAASDVNMSIYILYGNIINGIWRGAIQSVELGHFLRSWDKNSNGPFHLYIQGIIALIVAGVRERNDSWIALAVDYLGVPEPIIRGYLAHGDSMLLAVFNHFTRHLLHSDWVPIATLQLLSDFDIRNALPKLRRDFCALWNEMVREAQNSGPYSRHAQALLYIRPHYIALHRGTGDVLPAFFDPAANFDYILSQLLSDPFCNNPNHHLDQTPLVYEVAVREATHHDAPVVTSITVPHRDPVVDPIASSISPSRPDDTTLCPTSPGDLPDPIVMAESLRRASELSPPNPDQPLPHKPPPTTLSSP